MKKKKILMSVVCIIVCVASFIVATTIEIDGIKVSKTYVFPLYHLLLYLLAGIALNGFFDYSMDDKFLKWLDKQTWIDRFADRFFAGCADPSRDYREYISEETYRSLVRGKREGVIYWFAGLPFIIPILLGMITPPVRKDGQYMMVLYFSILRRGKWERTIWPFLNIYCAEEVHPLFFWVYAIIYLGFISYYIGGIMSILPNIIFRRKVWSEVRKNWLEARKQKEAR